MRSINFYLSNLEWVTSGGSYGSFTIESCLTLFDEEKKMLQSYHLGTSVLAGNMYVDGDLLKKPAYHFQLMLSNDFNRILRRPVQEVSEQDDENSITDTLQENSCFDSIRSNIVESNYLNVRNEPELIKALNSGYKLKNIRTNFDLDQGFIMSIESPVKHFNYLKDLGKWQIETGPVFIFDKRLTNYLHSKELLQKLTPAFMHANSFFNAYFTTEYPFRIKEDYNKGGKFNQGKMDCKIELLVSN